LENEEETRYFIDQSWYKTAGRSFSAMALSRVCASCKSKLGTEKEERVPVANPQTGKVTFELRKVTYGANPLVVIRDCCSSAKDYTTPHMPIMEIVFRIFLANANQPLTLEELRQQIEERANVSQSGRYVTAQTLERLIKDDRFYGIRPIVIPPAL